MLHHTVQLLLLVALLSATCAQAATLRGQIPSTQLLREYWLAGPSGSVVAYAANLTEHRTVTSEPASYRTFIKRDGSWALELPEPVAAADDQEVVTEEGVTRAVSPPADPYTYLLKFRVRGLQFRDFRVDVRPSKRQGQPAAIAVRAYDPSYPISSALYLSKPEPLPLVEGPSAAPSYFHSVQDFNALNYLIMTLKSPMILMAVGAWAMVSLLPKLTASLDPDAKPQEAKPEERSVVREALAQIPAGAKPRLGLAAGGAGASKK